MVTYLDYNASAPLDKRVLEKMIDVYTNHYGNSESRTHIYGANAKESYHLLEIRWQLFLELILLI